MPPRFEEIDISQRLVLESDFNLAGQAPFIFLCFCHAGSQALRG